MALYSFLGLFLSVFYLFSREKGLNNRYMHTLAYYTKLFSNKKIYF